MEEKNPKQANFLAKVAGWEQAGNCPANYSPHPQVPGNGGCLVTSTADIPKPFLYFTASEGFASRSSTVSAAPPSAFPQ